MPYNDAAREAAYRYKAAKIKRVPLDMQIDDYDALKAAASCAGQAVNAYIKQAVRERMERDRAANT